MEIIILKMIKRLFIALLMSSVLFMSYSCDKDSAAGKDDEYDPLNRGEKVEPSIKPGDNTDYYPKAEGSIRIMSYNVGAFNKFMESSTANIATIAAMIKEVEADVVGLNELDSVNLRHKVNQVAALAQELGGWNWYFGKAMNYREGSYGNGVVAPKGTKIIDRYFVTLPPTSKENSEQRSIAVIETDKYVIGAAHMEGSAMNQVGVVNEWVEKNYKDYHKPVFFVGDMNAVVGSEHITALETKFRIISKAQNSVPVNAPTRCIDYVFHYKRSAPVEVTGGGTMTKFRTGDPKVTSDHLPVYADVKF